MLLICWFHNYLLVTSEQTVQLINNKPRWQEVGIWGSSLCDGPLALTLGCLGRSSSSRPHPRQDEPFGSQAFQTMSVTWGFYNLREQGLWPWPLWPLAKTKLVSHLKVQAKWRTKPWPHLMKLGNGYWTWPTRWCHYGKRLYLLVLVAFYIQQLSMREEIVWFRRRPGLGFRDLSSTFPSL